MNWSGLCKVVLVLGLVLVVWGGILYMSNRPLTGGDGLTGAMTDLYNYPENRRRENSRNTAMYIMLGGTIVSFIGIGGLASLKKR